MAAIRAVILPLFLLMFAAGPAGANHDETCVLDWYDWEPDTLCLRLDWTGIVEQYARTPTSTTVAIAYWGLVEVDICVSYPTCVHNLPLVGLGVASPCDVYNMVGTCTGLGTPLYRPSVNGMPALCLEAGYASFYYEEHGQGPGVSGIPVWREVVC